MRPKAIAIVMYRNKTHGIREIDKDVEWMILYCGARVKLKGQMANFGKPQCQRCMAAVVVSRITGYGTARSSR